MRVTDEHVRILTAALGGKLYHDQNGRWRVAGDGRPSFRARRQLLRGGYLDARHRITDTGTALLRSKRGSLL